MNDTILAEFEPKHLDTIAGDGDGIRQNVQKRYAVPSSKKFTPTMRNNDDLRLKLQLALKEVKKSGSNNIRIRRKVDCASTNTPNKNIRKKTTRKSMSNREITLYATPREIMQPVIPSVEAARIILKCLLLNSWRKRRAGYFTLSESLKLKEEKINQFTMQIDVLQNLRRSEAARREDIINKYQDIEKKFDSLMQENIILQDRIELLNNDFETTKNEFYEASEQVKNFKDSCLEKQNTIRVLNEKYQRERVKSKRCLAEKRTTTEQNVKLENTLNLQKENLENLKIFIEKLQDSKQKLQDALDKSEESMKNYSEKLNAQSKLLETYKTKLSESEIERNKIENEKKVLQLQLDMARTDWYNLKNENESAQKEMHDLSQKLETERENSAWKLMKTGMTSTYLAVKYLADLMLPGLQSNFKF